ncbi:MAG TPA: glycosyltransferase family 39 protein [Pseudonocardia sp.]|nr:glycosyltransferase family 39 protein [Pseudonocardia sp.]
MTSTLDRPTTGAGAAPAPPPRRRWERFSLAGLLGGTALLNLWGLAASGWANSFYAAAVWAGTRSWKALLFGAFDPAGFITVDKPPASIWVMGLSGRIFGFSSWSMLAPEALMGVATVALLYASVRRVSGPVAALLAGAVLALTPVAVLMFRFDNPDALLVLLLVIAAYCVTRAIERAGTRWLVLAGVAIGFGFLTKMGAALVVLPALALAYLVAAPTGLGRRIRQLLGAGSALVVSAGWYVALVALWPAADRPYIGGSRTNSLLELALGYNGVSRLLGRSGGGPGGAGHFGGFGGPAGLSRLFSPAVASQVSWLLPAALALLAIGLWLSRRAPRTDRTRAALLLWGGWLLVTGVVFSLMAGIFHPYYTVALAPPVAAVIGIGGRELLARRTGWPARAALAVLLAGTGGWSWVLLDRAPSWHPVLRWAVLALTAAATLAVLVPGGGRRRLASVAAVAVAAGLLGPAAYAVQTTSTAHAGGTPSAGPTVPGSGSGHFARAGSDRAGADRAGPDHPASGTGVPGMRAGHGPGGDTPVDPAAARLLRAAGTTWSAATVSAHGASSLELGSDTAVLAIGGFMGSDPTPTLARFQADVAAGRIHYFIPESFGGGAGGPGDQAGGEPGDQHRAGRGGSRGTGGEISTWVGEHFAPVTVAGQTWYDLTRPAQPS